MTVVLNEPLSQISLLFVSAAMGLIAVALVFFSLQLSKLLGMSAEERTRVSTLEKLGFGATIIGTAVLGIGVVLRGVAAGRVPWANMYEFSISAAFLILLVYLSSLKIKDIRFVATFVTGFVLVTLFAAVSLFYVEVKTLMPALQSYWLVIHVVVAILATAFFSIAAGLHIAYLVKSSRFAKKLMELFPTLEVLERLAYRFNVVGFVLWSFTLIAGAIWAERAWHRYWGWDTKEVWTFIIWTLYAGYLHAMATRGWNGKRAAWLGLIAFLAIIFNFTIVNQFFKGLHVYSGL
ncbi:c-type cytochrome biogenesis protein CcsB [Aquiluna borgnonia]|uniref:C-type cytochrome biogenesis protein CcsB n=1 Tax=Aquiluna borgnonia TaxID=2499157 RepID=A0A7D4TUV4_9MICO|nr:c-type cytochrome biogenesis protein CcsB [Aquiluna borgnonia]QKJ25775.1 c-type cytochrome biogenesis protein CcsB [Aquiluna borgnonia]